MRDQSKLRDANRNKRVIKNAKKVLTFFKGNEEAPRMMERKLMKKL